MRLGPAILANLLLAVAALGAGSVFKGLLPSTWGKLDRLTAILLAGLGSLGTLIFLVGMVRLSRTIVLAILVPAALRGIWYFSTSSERRPAPFDWRNLPLIPVLVIGVVLAVTFVGGLAEPVGDFHTSDSIAYHYLGPRVWLRNAVIRPLPDESLSAFPSVVETLFVSLLATGGTRAMAFFSFTSLGLLLLVSYGVARCMGLDSSGALWATALIVTMPAVYRGCYDGYIDAILWSLVLLSLRLSLDATGPREAALAGVFSGFAMGTKYLSLIVCPLIFVCALLFYLGRRENSLKIFQRLVISILIAFAVASPWYFRNWIVLGCPIYPPPPGLMRFFHVKYMSAQAVASLAALVHKEGLGMGHDFKSFVLLPIRFTFHPANYLSGAGGVGLTLLAFAPFGVWVRWHDKVARTILLFTFLWTIAWFVTEQDARFIIDVFVIFTAFAIWGWQFVTRKAPRFGPFLAGFTVGCSILYGLIMIVPRRTADIRAALSPSYEDRRKTEEVPFLNSVNWLNHDPSVKRVLVLEPLLPTYYLEKDYIKPVGRFGEESLLGEVNLPKLLNDLPKLGVTHILDVDAGRLLQVQYSDRTEHEFRVPTNQAGLTLVMDCGDQRIYHVTSDLVTNQVNKKSVTSK